MIRYKTREAGARKVVFLSLLDFSRVRRYKMHEKQKNIKTEIPTMPQLWKHAAQYYRYQTYVLTAFGAVGILTYMGSSLLSSHSSSSSSASSKVVSKERK